MIAEFPGCVAQGDSVEEAYASLEDAAESWIQAALDLGHDIPPPAADQAFSGRVLLRPALTSNTPTSPPLQPLA